MNFTKTHHGFWKQNDPQPFYYTEEYKSVQKTTTEMSWLRLGFLFSVITPSECVKFIACDIGSGNGRFAKEASKCFAKCNEYDLSGQSISEDELYNTNWDIVFLTDVLEHFPEIDDLFKVNFRYGFLSFPETPEVEDWKELQTWRHFRPNEHIWCLNEKGMKEWFLEHGYATIAFGNPEDAIRKPQQGIERNITTMIVKKA